MPTEIYFNVAISGLLTGLIYGLSALGLSVIFGVIRIVNFAHGEIMVLGMFFTVVAFRHLGLDPLVAVPFMAAILFGFGYLLQDWVVRRVAHLHDYFQFLLMAAVAVMLIAICLMVFGPQAQGVTVDYALDSFSVGPLIIDKVRLYAGIVALLGSGAMFAFFKYTDTGKAIRACGDNYTGALVVGLNVRHYFALTFAIGCACLGAAGAIMVMIVDVHPYLGPPYTLLAFIIVILGGMGSLPGALLGGILIGMSEAMAGILLQPSLKSAFSFAILILVLLFRPQGLLGKVQR
ncbi:branched-chain amino acid ABC transporter permease [Pseudorhodoplanes sp.]|uniref:branched-chain amino acid ABC transporter permease n=1 Tax=Pseudorhodoplanes sp. TaxID=1934341 RepID=UPI00391C8456